MSESIDVVMCTYNSNTQYFNAILKRISKEIPVHCFIAVDRSSSDGTVNSILEVFPEAKIVQSQENLGRARKLGIESVDTDSFAFIDSDVFLLKGWYEYTKRLMDSKTGAVACFAKDEIEFNRGLDYERNYPHIFVSSKNNMDSQKGWTYATLIRKASVANWNPEKILCAGEDHQLLRQVVRNGFLWVSSYYVFAKHLVPFENYLAYYQNLWKKHKWNSAARRYIKLEESSLNKKLVYTMFKFWDGFKTAVLFRNALLIPISIVYCFANFYGYINWEGQLFLKR